MTNRREIIEQLERLVDAFPSAVVRDGTMRIYAEELSDLDPRDLSKAISRAIRECKWRELPTIALILEFAAENAAARKRAIEEQRREAERREREQEERSWREQPEEVRERQRQAIREMSRRIVHSTPTAEMTREQIEAERKRQLDALRDQRSQNETSQ